MFSIKPFVIWVWLVQNFLADNVMPSDVGLETEAQSVRSWRSPRVLNRKAVFHSSTTIRYRHIYECKNFSVQAINYLI